MKAKVDKKARTIFVNVKIKYIRFNKMTEAKSQFLTLEEAKSQFLTLETQRAEAIELLGKLNPLLTAMHAVESLDKMLSLNAYNLMYDRLMRIVHRTMPLLFGYKSRSVFLVISNIAIDELTNFVAGEEGLPRISNNYYEGSRLDDYRGKLNLRYNQFLLYEKVKNKCKDNIINYFNFCKYVDKNPTLYEHINDSTKYTCAKITLTTPRQISGRYAYAAYDTDYMVPKPETIKAGTRRRRNTRRSRRR